METAGRIAALLILATVAITLLIVAFQEAAPQPYLPLVAASCGVPANPCLTMDCTAIHPRGGVDPDAGVIDQRRLV